MKLRPLLTGMVALATVWDIMAASAAARVVETAKRINLARAILPSQSAV
ncbi:hypothetical protein [Nonomuraea sp. NPDC049158]